MIDNHVSTCNSCRGLSDPHNLRHPGARRAPPVVWLCGLHEGAQRHRCSRDGLLCLWFQGLSSLTALPPTLQLIINCLFQGHNVVVFTEEGQFLRRIGCENITNFPNGIDISGMMRSLAVISVVNGSSLFLSLRCWRYFDWRLSWQQVPRGGLLQWRNAAGRVRVSPRQGLLYYLLLFAAISHCPLSWPGLQMLRAKNH